MDVDDEKADEAHKEIAHENSGGSSKPTPGNGSAAVPSSNIATASAPAEAAAKPAAAASDENGEKSS